MMGIDVFKHISCKHDHGHTFVSNVYEDNRFYSKYTLLSEHRCLSCRKLFRLEEGRIKNIPSEIKIKIIENIESDDRARSLKNISHDLAINESTLLDVVLRMDELIVIKTINEGLFCVMMADYEGSSVEI